MKPANISFAEAMLSDETVEEKYIVIRLDTDDSGLASVHSVYTGECIREICMHPDLVGVHYAKTHDGEILETDCLSLAEALETAL